MRPVTELREDVLLMGTKKHSPHLLCRISRHFSIHAPAFSPFVQASAQFYDDFISKLLKSILS
jgi:hypothetical protein